MINFEEEIKKFHPSLEIEEAEDAIYNNNISDITDVMIHKIGLSVSRKKQMVCTLYQLAFLLPDDACGR